MANQRLALPYAINVIALLAIYFFLNQAMNVGFEAGEAFVEVAREFQVADDGFVEALAGDQERNAGG